MGTLPTKENPGFPDIYQLEDGDPFTGGLDGLDNRPHRDLAERTEYLRARADTAAETLEQHEQRLQTVEVSGSVAVGRAFPLYIAEGDAGAEFELWAEAPYSWRDYGPVEVLSTIAGDDSVDVASTNHLLPGRTYVIADPDGAYELLQVLEILTAQRVRAVAPLTRTRVNLGTLGRTNWDVRPGFALAGNGVLVSRDLRVPRYDSDGRLIIRRDPGDGILIVSVRAAGAQPAPWVACPLRSSTVVGETVDLEYAIPVGGILELRISSAIGQSGRPIRIEHMLALTAIVSQRADAVRRPNNTSPADGATGIQGTPVLTGNSYFSLYGLPQAGAQFRVSTDKDAANVVYHADIASPVTQATVPAGTLSTNTAYFWQARYKDTEGTWSPWSSATGFTAAATFQYVSPPTIAAPAAGSTTVPLAPTITTSAFAVVGGVDTHLGSQYQIATDSSFAAVVYDSGQTADLVSHTVSAGSSLTRATAYYLRARHKGTTIGWSDWSAVRSFTTVNRADAPTITSPTAGATGVSLTPTITTSAFSFPGGGEAHVASRYQIASDTDFAHLVYDSGETTALTSHTVPAGSALAGVTAYYLRAAHKGATTGWSDWSAAVSVTTNVAPGSVLLTTVGTAPVVVPAGCTELRYLLMGGGEGVGNTKGGGSGYVTRGVLAVTPGETLQVTVGDGGASAGYAVSRNIGGTTSIGSRASALGGGYTGNGNGGSGGGGRRTNGYCGNGGSGGGNGQMGTDSTDPGGTGQGAWTLSGFRLAFAPGAGGARMPYGGSGSAEGGAGGGGGIVIPGTTPPVPAGGGYAVGQPGTGWGAGGGSVAGYNSTAPGYAGVPGFAYLEWG